MPVLYALIAGAVGGGGLGFVGGFFLGSGIDGAKEAAKWGVIAGATYVIAKEAKVI